MITITAIASIAIYIWPDSYEIMGYQFGKYGYFKLESLCIEKHIQRIENGRISIEDEELKELILFTYYRRLATLNSDEIHNIDKAIAIVKKMRHQFKEKCKTEFCDFELSYNYYKKGDLSNAYEVFKTTEIGKKIDSRDEMIEIFQKVDSSKQNVNLRSVRNRIEESTMH